MLRLRSRTNPEPAKRHASRHRKGGRKALAALPVIVAAAVLAVPAAAAQASAAPAATPRHVGGHGLGPDTSFPPGTFTLGNYNSGLCLGISAGQAGQWYCTYQNDQAWQQGAQWGNSGFYQVKNAKGQCLGVSGGSTNQGARLVGYQCLPHPDQYWAVSTGNACGSNPTYYPIVNYNSRMVIGVSGNSLSNGAPVVQWTFQGPCNNQFWGFANP